MALNIGDAVLRFFGDTSQLDQAFARIPGQAEAAMGAAAGSTTVLGEALGGVNFELDATASNVPYCGEVIKEAMGESSRVTREAKGEAGLLGEAFGIHLPRHVRSFIAELPGVGTALSAAFAATAVLFIIEAIAQGVEKLQEWANSGEKIKAAMEAWDESQRKVFNGLEDGSIKAQIRLDELTGKHFEALLLKLKEIDHQNLDNLGEQLQKLGKEAQGVMELLDRNWFSQAFLGLKGSEDAQDKLKELQKSVSEALADRTPKAYGEAMTKVSATMDVVAEKVRTLTAAQEQFEKMRAAAESANVGHPTNVGLGPDPNELAAWQQLGKVVQGYAKDIQEAQGEAQKLKKTENIQEADRLAKSQYDTTKKYDDLIAASHAQRDKEIEARDNELAKIQTFHLNDELKKADDLAKQALKLEDEKQKAAIAAIDGEMAADEQKYQQQALLLKGNYDRGLITGQQYLAALKALNSKEVEDLRQALEVKGRLVILQSQNEAAQRGKILTDAEAKELKSYVDIENKKAQIQTEFDNKFLKEQDKVTAKLAKEHNTINGLLDGYVKHLRAAEQELKGFAKVADATLTDVTDMFGTAITQWLSGQKSFGEALKEALQQYLANLAGKAAADALYFTAWGIADTFWNPARAGVDFAAAAEFAAIAGVAGGTAAAMGKPGGAGGGSNQTSITQDGSTQAAKQPTGTANIPKLYSGAIVTQPTLAMVGDSSSGGSSREAIIPLGDPRAMREIMAAFGGGGGQTVNHYHLPDFSWTTSEVTALSRRITRNVKTGRVRTTVTAVKK